MRQQTWAKVQLPPKAHLESQKHILTPVKFGCYPPSSLRENFWQYNCQHKVFFACGSASKVGQNTITPKGTFRALKDPPCKAWLFFTQ